MTFDEESNQYLNRLIRTPSTFAKEHLLYIQEAGHYGVLSPNMFKWSMGSKEPQYLLFYVIHGQGIVYYIDDYYALVSGDVFLFDCSKYFFISNHNWEVYYCLLGGLHITDIIGYSCVHEFIFDFRLKSQMETFFKLILPKEDHKQLDDMTCSSNVMWLLAEIHTSIFAEYSSQIPKTLIRDALIFIENNYMNDITVKQIAEHVGYSEFYFSRMFRDGVKETPYNYLLNRRLSQARLLLTTTDLCIEDIAYQSGFFFKSNFYAIFKKQYHITPRQYRLLSS